MPLVSPFQRRAWQCSHTTSHAPTSDGGTMGHGSSMLWRKRPMRVRRNAPPTTTGTVGSRGAISSSIKLGNNTLTTPLFSVEDFILCTDCSGEDRACACLIFGGCTNGEPAGGDRLPRNNSGEKGMQSDCRPPPAELPSHFGWATVEYH